MVHAIFPVMESSSKPWLDPALPPLPPLDAAEILQIDLFRAMTPYQRWEKAQLLRDLVWKMRTVAIKRSNPDWTPTEVEQAVREFFISANT